MIRRIGAVKTNRRRWRTRSKRWARGICRGWEKKQPNGRARCTLGPGYLSGFFAFTARSVQTTKGTPPPHEQGEALYDPQLSQERSRSRPAVVLSDRISRLAD